MKVVNVSAIAECTNIKDHNLSSMQYINKRGFNSKNRHEFNAKYSRDSNLLLRLMPFLCSDKVINFGINF